MDFNRIATKQLCLLAESIQRGEASGIFQRSTHILGDARGKWLYTHCCTNAVESTKLIPWGWGAGSCLPPLKRKESNKGWGLVEKNKPNTKPTHLYGNCLAATERSSGGLTQRLFCYPLIAVWQALVREAHRMVRTQPIPAISNVLTYRDIQGQTSPQPYLEKTCKKQQRSFWGLRKVLHLWASWQRSWKNCKEALLIFIIHPESSRMPTTCQVFILALRRHPFAFGKLSW